MLSRLAIFVIAAFFSLSALSDNEKLIELPVNDKFPALSTFIGEEFISLVNLRDVVGRLSNDKELRDLTDALQVRIREGDKQAELKSKNIYNELVYLHEWIRLDNQFNKESP